MLRLIIELEDPDDEITDEEADKLLELMEDLANSKGYNIYSIETERED